MMPHSKKECKIEKKDIADQINELCYIHSCCNFLFFEARKKSDLYLHAGRFPNGPTVKFQVENRKPRCIFSATRPHLSARSTPSHAFMHAATL